MSFIDILIIILLVAGMINGFRKGLILQFASLLALLLGIYCALKYNFLLAQWLDKQVGIEGSYLNIIAFSLIFVLVVLLIHLISKLVERFVKLVALGWLNRLGGVLFSLAKNLFILSILLNLFVLFNIDNKIFHGKQNENSILFQPVISIAPAVFPYFVEKMHKPGKQNEENADVDEIVI